MTRKLADVEAFYKELKYGNGATREQITDQELRIAIMRKFGISSYMQKTIIEALKAFGYIRETPSAGVWKLGE